MKIVRNKFIPFTGFSAINLFGILFVREDVSITDQLLNHERIHSEQMKEMLYIPFYIWYFIEWLIRLFIISSGSAYRSISFEQEAYAKESDFSYLSERKSFSWIKYLRK